MPNTRRLEPLTGECRVMKPRPAFIVNSDDTCGIGCADGGTGNVFWTCRACTGPQGTYYGPGAFAVQGNRAVVGTVDG